MAIPTNRTKQSPTLDHPLDHNKIAHFYNSFEHVSEHGSIQSAIDAAIISKRAVWFEPGKIYDVSETIVIKDTRRLIIYGNNATIRANTNMTALLDINGVNNCSFRDFDLNTSNGAVVTDMIYYRWDGITKWVTTRNIFENIYIQGTFINGVRIGEPLSSLQVDNTQWNMIGIRGDWITGETTNWQRGFIVGTGIHANNMLHTFTNCVTIKNRIHYEIAACRYVSISGSGSFAEIDVWSNATRAVNMQHYRSERSGMLFKADAGGASYPMLHAIRDCGFHSHDDNWNLNYRWIEVNYGGSLILENIAIQPVPDNQNAVVYGINLQKPLYVRAHGLAIENTPKINAFDIDNAVIVNDGYIELTNSGSAV